MGGYSQNNLSVKCISGSFLMLCPKGGHFVEIWWLDYYRAGKWAGTLKITFLSNVYSDPF